MRTLEEEFTSMLADWLFVKREHPLGSVDGHVDAAVDADPMSALCF